MGSRSFIPIIKDGGADEGVPVLKGFRVRILKAMACFVVIVQVAALLTTQIDSN